MNKSKSTLGKVVIAIGMLLIVLGMAVLFIQKSANVVSLVCITLGTFILIVFNLICSVVVVDYIEKQSRWKSGNLKLEDTVEKEKKADYKMSGIELIFYMVSLVVLITMIIFLVSAVKTHDFRFAIMFQLASIVIMDFIILMASSDKDVKSIRMIYIYTVVNVLYYMSIVFIEIGKNGSLAYGLQENNVLMYHVLQMVDVVAILFVYPFYIFSQKKLVEKIEKLNNINSASKEESK